MNADLPGPVIRQLEAASEAQPPSELLDQLASQIRITPQRRQPLLFSAFAAGAVVATIAAAIAVVAVVGWWRSSPPPAAGDGLPETFEGQPVYRGRDDILAHVASDRTDSPFFVGGVLRAMIAECVGTPPPSWPTSPLAPGCSSSLWYLADARPESLIGLIVEEPLRASESLWELQEEPVILRVHAHDSRAAECAAEIRAECERAIVVEAIVWSGASP
jgi:hypothetical protein